MTQLPVKKITENASADPVDYLAILNSLRGPLYNYSWQRIADETGYNSKSWWRFVALGERELDEDSKNALRRLTEGELPPQPPSVTAVTADYIHPDAAMYMIGELEPGERVRRVLMLAGSDAVTVYANGTVEAVAGASTPASAENAAMPAVEAQGASGDTRQRKAYWRPCLPLDLQQRAEAAGLDIQQLIEDALGEVTK
jgi:hypothetical protein